MLHVSYKNDQPTLFASTNFTDISYGSLQTNFTSFSSVERNQTSQAVSQVSSIQEFPFNSDIEHNQPSGFKKFHHIPNLDILTSLGFDGKMKIDYMKPVDSASSFPVEDFSFENSLDQETFLNGSEYFSKLKEPFPWKCPNETISDFDYHPVEKDVLAIMCPGNKILFKKIYCSHSDDKIDLLPLSEQTVSMGKDKLTGCLWKSPECLFLKTSACNVIYAKFTDF